SRRCSTSNSGLLLQLGGDARQAEHESCSVSGPVAVRTQVSAELLREDGARVEPEAVAVLLRRESEREQPAQYVGRDADARVLDVDRDRFLVLPPQAHRELPARRAAGLERVTRVAEQVAEDLDQLVSVERDGGEWLVFAPHGDVRH